MNKSTLILGDCLAEMPKLEAGSIDACFTDPPYAISREMKITRGRNRMKFRGPDINYHHGDWDVFDSEEKMWEFTHAWVDRVIRLLKDDAVFVTFFDRAKINYLADYVISQGFKLRNFLAWVKSNPVPQARCVNWQSSVELAVVLTRGKHHYNWESGQHPEHWLLPIVGGNARVHPTQKPLLVFQDLVRWWTFPDDIVLDPFAGSGTTIVACESWGRRSIGIEKDPNYYESMLRRVEVIQRQGILWERAS